MKAKVGILGLGLIGRTAAELLIRAAHTCYAVRRRSTENFPAMGGILVDTPADLARSVDILISSLPTAQSGRDAFLRDDGVVAGAHAKLTIVEMSTFSLASKEELRSAVGTAAVILDCPISGTPPMIMAGKGVIIMSGDADAANRVRPVLELIAPKTFYAGPYGTGTKLKLVINFLVAANTVSVAEAMLLGTQMGLDPKQMIEVIGPSAGGSTTFNVRAPLIAERKWYPTSGPAKLFWKDLDIIKEQADALGLSAPMLRICNQYFTKVAKAGRLDEESAVVYEMLEQEIGRKPSSS